MNKFILLSLLALAPTLVMAQHKDPSKLRQYACTASSKSGVIEKVYPIDEDLVAESKEEAIEIYLKNMDFDSGYGESLSVKRIDREIKIDLVLLQGQKLNPYSDILTKIECELMTPDGGLFQPDNTIVVGEEVSCNGYEGRVIKIHKNNVGTVKFTSIHLHGQNHPIILTEKRVRLDACESLEDYLSMIDDSDRGSFKGDRSPMRSSIMEGARVRRE